MSKLDVLSSPSVGFFTPPSSQSVFLNYKLEIQDGQGTEVEVIKLESFRFSPNQQCTSSLSPYCLHPYLWASGGWPLIPRGPLCQGQQPHFQNGQS